MAKNSGIGPKIQELKSQGLNQNQVRLKLKCSGATVYYHWSKDRKNKSQKSNQKWKRDNFLEKKLQQFIYTSTLKYNGRPTTYKEDFKSRLTKKISRFKQSVKGKEQMINSEKIREHIENNPYCYLTGRKIDIYDTRSYHFDHKIPVSRGGNASFENLGVACREANQSKNDMTEDEFVKFCIEIVKHHGYKVVEECE